MNILVIGAGYVGLSNAILLSLKHNVTLIDINKKKLDILRSGKSPISEKLINKYLAREDLKLNFDNKFNHLISKVKIVIIATPTNFDNEKNSFDTSAVENVLKQLTKLSYSQLVVIKSTVPIGFTNRMQKKYKGLDVSFFPEFLREGQALKDSLYPSRIICGSKSKKAKSFCKVLQDCSLKKNIPILTTESSEAEAIKLFSNSYLAMRIAFFNELDSFALSKNLDTKSIIEGVSLDQRIGNYYNNPSFGYGGYCLPKDTKQLEIDFNHSTQKLISATINSNASRKEFIYREIKKKKIKKIGIYRLSMKAGSDNWRDASILEIIKALKKNNLEILVFEPELKEKSFMELKVEKNLETFLKKSNLIIANRIDKFIDNYPKKVFSRDLYRIN